MRDDREDKIIETARELFISRGFKATSIQQIAEGCGISKGAVYLHFPSKEAILLAIARRMDEKVLKQVLAIKEDPRLTPRERLRAQLLQQYDFMVENRTFHELFLQETGLSLENEILAFLHQARYRWQNLQEEFLLMVYGDRLERWKIDAAVILNGTMQEYHSFFMFEGVSFEPEKVADFLVELMDHVSAGLIEKNVEPLLRPEMLPAREELEKKTRARALHAARQAVEGMIESLADLEIEEREREAASGSLSLLHQALKETEPNRVLVRGMLASLRDIDELETLRKDVARYLDVRLV